jgi:hypothetical protein
VDGVGPVFWFHRFVLEEYPTAVQEVKKKRHGGTAGPLGHSWFLTHNPKSPTLILAGSEFYSLGSPHADVEKYLAFIKERTASDPEGE